LFLSICYAASILSKSNADLPDEAFATLSNYDGRSAQSGIAGIAGN
jgi:hypothetical protein